MSVQSQSERLTRPMGYESRENLDATAARFPMFRLGLLQEARKPLWTDASETAKAWLDAEEQFLDGQCIPIDPKTRCAFVLTRLGWIFAFAQAALYFDGSMVLALRYDCPLADEIDIQTSVEVTHSIDDGRQTLSRYIDYKPMVAPSRLQHADGLDDADVSQKCRSCLLAVFSPLIQAMKHHSKLSEGAQWRIVADMVAAAFLTVGREVGDVERGMRLGDMVVRGEATALSNPQTGYMRVDLLDDACPGKILASEWALARGGCCRSYTTGPGFQHCSTCVLIKHEQKVDNVMRDLRQHLCSTGLRQGRG